MIWDKRYSEPGFAYGVEPNDFLVSSMHKLKPGGSILCLAEGEGRNSVFLAQNGFQVTAVDNSAVGLEKARQLAVEKGVHITTQLADLGEYLIAPESYDAVVSIFCHLVPRVRLRLHKQIYPSLKKSGTFILEAFTPKQLQYGTGGPQQEEMLMKLNELKEELHPLNFDIAREIDREVHEGNYHSGMGAVVQLIGVK